MKPVFGEKTEGRTTFWELERAESHEGLRSEGSQHLVEDAGIKAPAYLQRTQPEGFKTLGGSSLSKNQMNNRTPSPRNVQQRGTNPLES